MFKCNTCGTDNLLCSCPHHPPETRKYLCPICHEPKLDSEDPLDNDWVALGEAVCGHACHEEAYRLMNRQQLQLGLIDYLNV